MHTYTVKGWTNAADYDAGKSADRSVKVRAASADKAEEKAAFGALRDCDVVSVS